jgi:NTP pyrophosphatase (non-canonical NTP hydrolase)
MAKPIRFEEIAKRVIEFRDERNWGQFHQIKDLLLGLNIEVGELQELYLWKSAQEQAHINIDDIRDEVADIAIYLIYICNHHNIDLLEAISSKVEKNGLKYPVEKSRNSNRKYHEL